MSLLHKPLKAQPAARNAVQIATRDVEASPTVANRLDLAVYQYSLATYTNSEELLRTVIASLKSSAFDPLKKSVVRNESFEVYSTARGDEAAYVSLLNRAQLRLGALYEERGNAADARAAYESVLASRSDDPTALAALARLAPDERAVLDAMTFVGTATFKPETRNQKPEETVFERGTIEGVPFRFAEAAIFHGSFPASTPLRLTYRILGVTDVNGADGLLIEPIR